MTTGGLIKTQRKKRGLTQKELGARLGVSYQTVAQWENNLRNPKIETLRKIANALECDLSDLDNSTSIIAEAANANILKQHPEIKDLANRAMVQLYGTTNKTEASKVALVHWIDAISDLQRETFFSLLMAYQALNDEGCGVAVDRVEELGQIPKYQRNE